MKHHDEKIKDREHHGGHACCGHHGHCHDHAEHDRHSHHHHEHDHHGHHHHGHGECCCGEGIEHLETGKVFLYIIGALALALAFLPMLPDVMRWICAGAVYVAFGYSVWKEMIEGIAHGHWFTEFTLMCVASVGAVALLEYADAAAVMYLYALGETVSGLAGGRARRNIAELIAITPEHVTVLTDGETKVCEPTEVHIGDTVLVRAGERIPLDGVVRAGNGAADTSSVTGEQLPAELTVGSKCLSGSVLISGSVEIEITHDYENSVAAQLKAAVEEASKRKAVREKRIARLAAVITPAAFGVALAIFGIGAWVTGDVAEWFRRGLVILVCSCPCSLLLSIPLTYFAGIGSAAGQGIVFRGGEVVDSVARMETLMFDKTGTLTESALRFEQLTVAETAALDRDEVEAIAYALLLHSPHAAAQTFCKAAVGIKMLPTVENIENLPGRGIRGSILNETVLAGNAAMMAEAGIAVCETGMTSIHLALGDRYLGVLSFSSNIKEGTAEAVGALRRCGVRRMALISGDAERTVREVAQTVGLDEYYAERMPAEKLSVFEDIYREEKQHSRGSVAFCGDGLNDSAVIAASDVGFAMGRGGSAVTVEAADAVLMDDDPAKIVLAMRLSKRIVRIANQNIAISLGLKIGIAAICAMLVPSMEIALIADVGAAVITVLNAMRAGKRLG